MTSLEAQLQNLQTTQTDCYDQQKKTVSVLFSAAEAQNITRETYYKLGYDGFQELQQKTGFAEFAELFSEDSQGVQRTMLSANENRRLDEKLDSFLIQLGPHLELNASLKSLEWLVQRYLVQDMNTDSFISCILPYFETQLFSRLLQIVNLNRSKTWHWLKPTQKSVRPLPRRNLFNQWISTEWFRNFVANSFMKQMNVVPAKSLNCYAVFFILAVEGGLSSLNKITETHLTTLCRTMDKCLLSDSLAAKGGMSFLLFSLSSLTTLADRFTCKILESLCNCFQLDGPLCRQMIACTISIVHTQDVTNLPHSICDLLLSHQMFFDEVLTISKVKNVSKFILSVVSSSSSFLFSGNIAEDDILEKFNKIVALLQAVTLPSEDAKNILNIFIMSIREKMDLFKNLKNYPNFGEIMAQLDVCQPACVPHEAASELITNPTEKEDYLVNHTSRMEVDSLDDKKSLITKDKFLQREEIKSSIISIKNNILLKSTNFHMLREEDCSNDFQDLVNILHVVIKKLHDKPTSNYVKIIRHLFNNVLKTSDKKMYFLSMIWSSSSSSFDNLDSSLKKWALTTATELIKNSTQNDLIWMMDSGDSFVPSLFAPICETATSVLAFEIIEILVRMLGPKNGHKSQNFMVLLKAMLTYRAEIIDDAKFLPQALEMICKDDSAHLKLMSSVIADESVHMRVKRSLLHSLSNVSNFATLLSFVPVANEILDRVKLTKGELSFDLSLCLYYILLRIPECPLKKIANSDVASLLLRCIRHHDKVIKIRGKLYAPQELVFTEDFVLKMSRHDDFFSRILESVVDLIEHSEDVPIAGKFRSQLANTTVSGDVLLKVMGTANNSSNTSSMKEARAKRRKKDDNSTSGKDLSQWRRLRFVLDLIGIFSQINNSWVLIKPLFGRLELSLRGLPLNTKGRFGEIFHQRLLTTIYQLLEVTKKELSTDEIRDKVKINFSMLVQLMRTTDNPDTRRRVLMILSLVTPYFPDDILQNVIGIFTFMGANLIKMDDDYSIQVIHQAMDKILPPLIESVQSDPENLNNVLFQILKVFIDAFPDIPQQRKQPLYLQLAHTIGSDHLWLLMAATAEAHVFQQPKEQSSRREAFHLGHLTSLWDRIFRHFPVIDRLNNIKRVIQFLVDIPEDKDALNRNVLGLQTKIIKKMVYTTQQLRLLKLSCTQIIISFLSSSQLAKEIGKIKRKESEFEFSRVYHIILDVAIPYLKTVSLKSSSSENLVESKYWVRLEQKLTDLVKVMFELLPPHLLFKVVLNLVGSEDLHVRCKALQTIVEKLDSDYDFFLEEHSEDASKFIKYLSKAVKKNGITDEARQLSISTLQSVLRAFGDNIEADLVQSVLQSSVKIMQKNKVSSDIKLQTVLVAVEGIVILEENGLESLNEIVEFIVSHLQLTLDEPTVKIDPPLLILATSLQRITKILPQHLGTQLPTIIYILCGLTYHFQASKHSEFVACLESTQWQVLTIQLNMVLDAMKEAYFSLLSCHCEYLPLLFRQLSTVVTENEIEAIFSNVRSIQKFFSLALQIRTSITSHDNIDEIEEAYFKAVFDFITRCEVEQTLDNFNVLKNKCRKYAQIPITVTFYRLCSYISSSLGVLFISCQLAEEIWDEAIAILSSNNSSNSEDMFNDDNILLVDAVLDTMHNIFVHDTAKYMNRGRITACTSSIVNQLDNVMGGRESYKNRITHHLKPCLARLATVCRNEDVWTALSQMILVRIKNEWTGDNLIILGTLEVFEGIVDEAGCEFVQSQLKDIMVYIAEALEIIDPEIQLKTKQIFTKLEDTLGESLRSYIGS